MLDKTITNPGFHKQFILERFNQDERKILSALSADWYLTNSGDTVQIAQSRYDYFLMKPTPRTAEMFNIEREIVCVFSDYANFEPRSLDIFDRILTTLPKLRAETICQVLICRAPGAEDKVDRLLKSDPEHPIVLPFTYGELLRGGSITALVENRFRKHFFSRDLFSFLSPLKKDTYFFGRASLINELVNRHKSGEHSSLFGLRKSGKTSIVYAIERRLESTGDLVVSLDCESPSIHLLRWNELLEKIVVKYRELRNSKIKLETTGRYGEKLAAESFENDILKIWTAKKPSPALFIFDEIERITPSTASSEHWRTGSDFIFFWQSLRGFFQKHPQVFTYMIAGTNPTCVESAMLVGHENPIYASIPSQYVPAFTLEQVRQMVSRLGDYMGLRFDDLVYSKLTDDFGGHPFLIRQMCSLLAQKTTKTRPARIDKALYQKTKTDFNEASKEYLELMIQVLRDWYPDEYEMLRFLAQGDMASFSSFASDSPSYTRHLIGYGLIQQSSNGYAFNLESLADLLRSKHRNERLNLTQEEKLQELSARRVEVEKKLRTLARNALTIMMGAKKAQTQILAALPEQRRSVLATSDLVALLHRDKSPLFLLELINVITREWAAFENVLLIDKAKFKMILEEINAKGRPEAHAKAISDDDFTLLRLYLKQIEELLDS